MNKKNFAFIDATNIIYGASDSGWRMDFKKLYRYLKDRFNVSRILYFAGRDKDNLKQLKFYKKLESFGYELYLVPVKVFRDGRKKADVDSRMTFEMMLHKDQYRKTIVMTGDGDFFWILEYLIKIGKIVKLIAHQKSTAKELKQLFRGDFIPLNSIRHMIELKIKK